MRSERRSGTAGIGDSSASGNACDTHSTHWAQSCLPRIGAEGCGCPPSASAWQMGTSASGSRPAASGPNGIAATAMIWHHAASHVTVNRTADFITRAFNLTCPDQ